MTIPKKRLRTTFHVDAPELDLLALEDVTADLAVLRHSRPGDLLGFALGHGTGAAYPTGTVTEYCCAFLTDRDGRSCDGTSSARKPKDRATERAAIKRCNPRLDLARRFQAALCLRDGEFETLHFRHFTAAMIKDVATGVVTELRIYLKQPQTLAEAKHRRQEIQALFAFLSVWHDQLCQYQIELAEPETLLSAA